MKIESLGGERRQTDEDGELIADSAERASEQDVGASRVGIRSAARAGRRMGGRTSYDPSVLTITDIRQGVKNPNRANIFINGKFGFSLDITQLVDYKLKIGKVLSDEDLEELKNVSNFGKLYQRTLEWVLSRPRSIKETRDYLRRKIYEKKLDPVYQERILERLLEKKYLDDAKFAQFYVENRFVKKGISAKRLKMELYKKGVSESDIEQALVESERNDEEEIRKMIAKKRAHYDDEKLIQYLCRQGFSYSLVRELVAESED